jgi:hypothetical protein
MYCVSCEVQIELLYVNREEIRSSKDLCNVEI